VTTSQRAHRITAVAIKQATKLFGTVRALNRLSLEVTAGEVVAVMGANGAGKSTLLSLLSLSARPTRGSVCFNGKPVAEVPWVREKVGLLSHDAMLYPDLTAAENLRLFAKLFGVADASARVEAVSLEMGITPFLDDRPVRVLSRGQLQRVALARAVVNEPDLLLLDEPAAGLDSRAIDRIKTAIERHVSAGGMAVVVTHEPDVAAHIATRAAMMRRGAMVVDRPAPMKSSEWRALYIDAMGEKACAS
jgi:heme exporter protein A